MHESYRTISVLFRFLCFALHALQFCDNICHILANSLHADTHILQIYSKYKVGELHLDTYEHRNFLERDPYQIQGFWPDRLTFLSVLMVQVAGAVLEDAVADLAVESWSSSVWTALNDLCLSDSRL